MSVVFERILVAVDGSDASREALDHAVDLARRSGAALTGLFVIDDRWADFIGNDWQSARNARQGFLDYVREEQEEQARRAREQFEAAAGPLPGASFDILAGDPCDTLLEQWNGGGGRLLILGKRVFQVSGRPSLKSLARRLAEQGEGALMLFP